MNAKSVVISVAALALTLGSFADAAAQSAERRNRGSQRQERSQGDSSARQRTEQGDRSRSSAARGGQGAERTQRAERSERAERGSQSQDRERQRASAPTRQRENEVDRSGRDSARNGQRGSGVAERNTRDYRGSNDRARTQGRDNSRSYDRGRDQGRGGYDRRDGRDYRGSYSSGYSRGYYAPRRLQYRSAPRRYYGSGARLTLYFGIGSGYRYGSPYSGRVYGYRRSVPTYGNYVVYGDLRLKVSPRHASVYVDGYYAGVVDDFDGFFQRLTLEVGPHEIEVEAPGYGSQVFDVYVDPERTIDLHADLER